MAFFGVVAVLSDSDDPTPGLLVLLGAVLATGLLLVAWLPDRIPGSLDGE